MAKRILCKGALVEINDETEDTQIYEEDENSLADLFPLDSDLFETEKTSDLRTKSPGKFRL